MSRDLAVLVVPPEATLRDALLAIDAGGQEIALVVDEAERLVGVVTDGDLRPAILKGATLDDRVSPYVTHAPHTVGPEVGRADVLDLMRAWHVDQIPVVMPDGSLGGLHVLHDLLGAAAKPNTALIMAGGRGRRLGPLTDEVPKPMIPVAGRPILERLVLHLVGCGIRDVSIAVNYRAELIEQHFGDGSEYGCRISYLREQPENPLGTAGPLRLLNAERSLNDPILVMNGDLVTDVDVDGILRHHAHTGATATVAVYDYWHEIPFGVVELDSDGRARGIHEKPTASWPVNAGICVLDPAAIGQVPPDVEFPLTGLLDRLITEGELVVAWPLAGQWEDIGHLNALRRARGEF